jgi:hypothetical protein
LDTHTVFFETRTRSHLIDALRDAFSTTWQGTVDRLDQEIRSMQGMSGRKYRTLVNNLINNMPDARYLEIGSWAGSTLCAAIYNNEVRALAIDNWSEFGGPAGDFMTNVGRFRNPRSHVSFLEQDFKTVRFDAIGKYNIYLFDGPHFEADQYEGIVLAQPALDEQFVLIVDDWNFPPAQAGTKRAFADLNLQIDYAIEIRTTLDGSLPEVLGAISDWHNGYFLAVVSKQR